MEQSINYKEIPVEEIYRSVNLNENFKIKLDISLNCNGQWIKIFDPDYLKITGLRRVNGPQIDSYLDKEIIEFKPLKKGEIKLKLLEINYLGPYREIIYNIKIADESI
ncbi:hypothetical protein [Methanobacterium sp. ACI-7]|uniref:hypothetical protein n=1 Tax=unclassified Methanobacterium TaxID=2627676 RepID=UPI0039C0D662